MQSRRQLAKPRSRHSYRDAIARVIQERIVLGKPLTQRAIIEDAGGGSASTVLQELAKIGPQTAATRVGVGTETLPERIVALENALNACLAREQRLVAEKQALESLLTTARSDLDKLLASHQDSQHRLLQAVDDFRQMTKAAESAPPPSSTHSSSSNTERAADAEDGILWKARHDALLQRFLALDTKSRQMALQLSQLGVDV